MIDILIDNDYHYRIKIIPRLQYSVERMNFSYFSPDVCPLIFWERENLRRLILNLE